MTRIPVKFRDSLNISEPLKDFIKRCLEVDERQRMSLEDLKVWMSTGGHHHTKSDYHHHEPNVLGQRQ